MAKIRSLNAWGGITEGHEETFGDDSYVHYLDIGKGFMSNLNQILHFQYGQFIICHIDLNLIKRKGISVRLLSLSNRIYFLNWYLIHITKIQHFKVQIHRLFCIWTRLYNNLYYLIPEHFHHPKEISRWQLFYLVTAIQASRPFKFERLLLSLFQGLMV